VTNAELAVLSLIAERPRHGYEIEQVIEQRGMREWTDIGFSSIYYLLKKLERQGLIEGQLENAQRGPARKVYRMTEAGHCAAHQGTVEALSVPLPCHPPLHLGLANLPAVPHAEAVAALREYHDGLARRKAHVRQRWEHQQPLPPHVDAMFDYSLAMLQAEMTWVHRFARDWEVEMDKVDFKKQLKHLYAPSKKEFTVVEVPPMQFLMYDGHGDPNTSEQFQGGMQALYALAYTIKFMSKQELARDYTIPPVEGLWWTGDMEQFNADDKDTWDWTLMIMQPDWVSAELFEKGRQEAKRKKGLPELDDVRLETYDEGLSVQIMHVGPYDAEGPTLNRMHHEFIPQQGFATAGKHHEIYLSDPRRAAPEKLKTVLRQPVRKLNAS
jgi:hypothetical protein